MMSSRAIVALLIQLLFVCSLVRADSKAWECDRYKKDLYVKVADCWWLGEPQTEIITERIEASGPVRCAQTTACSITLTGTVSKSKTENSGWNIRVKSAIKHAPFWNSKITANLGHSYDIEESASRSQTVTCYAKPGQEVQLFMETKELRVTGKVQKKIRQWDMGFERKTIWQETDADVTTPIVSNDLALAGPMICSARPISDTTEVSFSTVDEPLDEKLELPLVESALSAIADVIPPRGQSVLKTADKDGVKAFVRSQCHNSASDHEYGPVCRGCINYLRDRIISKSHRGQAANWKVEGCSLRYALAPFEM